MGRGRGQTAVVGGAVRANRSGVVLCLLLAAAIGVLAARAAAIAGNSLERSGRWTATKAEMARQLLGARSFYSGPQALAGGRLDLGAWHGFHEVYLRRPLDPATVELKFQLTEGSYLAVLFNELPGEDLAGLRIGWNRRFPSIFFTASADGEFSGRQSTGLPTLRYEGWHYLHLAFEPDGVVARLDDRPPVSFATPIRPSHRIGFRSGSKSVRIDDLVVTTRSGDIVRESFDHAAHAARWGALAGLAAVAGGGVLIALLAATGGTLRRRLMALATVELVVLVIALLSQPLAVRRARSYPRHGAELAAREETLRRQELDRVTASIEADYPRRPARGRRRLLFVGASQTWGAGARTDDEVWVRRLEGLLDRSAAPPLRFECINAGASSARSRHLADRFEQQWIALRPWGVIVNHATNDPNPTVLERNVGRIVVAARDAGARVVLVLEPNSPEMWLQPLRAKHEALRQLGRRHAVPVVEMQSHLEALYDTGFLWWDIVHLTSYGQRLFAEEMSRELVRLGFAERLSSPASDAAPDRPSPPGRPG